MTWSLVAAAHLAAAAAVVGGAPSAVREPVREGGRLLLVSLSEPEPVAPAGEAPAGAEAGAGASSPSKADSIPVAPSPAARSAVAADSVVPPDAAAVSPPVLTAPAPAPVLLASEPVLEPPAFLVREEPAYPSRARRAGAEGRVVLRIAISATGEVTGLSVQESSGSASLDEAALAAARASRFSPARRGGVAEPSEAVAAYRFELR